MLRRILLCLALASLPLSAELIKDQPLGQQQGAQVRKLTYRSQRYQVEGLLFLPKIPQGQRRPVVIFSHDGISGISREHRLSCLRLCKSGYVVFAPSYRGEDGSEGEIEIAKGEVEDVLAAISLMQQVPQADTQRLALAGASHGALISLLVAARTDQVKALVLAYGVMDIYRWWDYLNRNGKVGHDAITRRTYGDGPEARPHSFALRNGVSVVDKINCPVLVLQGKKDDIVPYQQALMLEKAMHKAGKAVQVELYSDCLHGFLVYAPFLPSHDVSPAERRQTEQSWKTMLQFLEKNL
jgi:dipeptidyl aminopeptidase/acylaminoacyl peptidase